MKLRRLVGSRSHTQQEFRAYDHETVRLFAHQRVKYMLDVLGPDKITNAVDVGAGNGSSSFYLGQFISDLWALEKSSFLLMQHPFHRSGRVVRGDALHLPFRDRSFDLVYGWEVLHHLPEPRRAIAEMARVSRRFVVVSDPNRWNPAQFAFALYDAEHRSVLHSGLTQVQQLFAEAGLHVFHAASGGWIFPNKTPLCLSRILLKIGYISRLGISNWVFGRRD